LAEESDASPHGNANSRADEWFAFDPLSPGEARRVTRPAIHPGTVTGTQLLAEHFRAQGISPLGLLNPPGQTGAAAAAARATPASPR
jgi:hypothetical protein